MRLDFFVTPFVSKWTSGPSICPNWEITGKKFLVQHKFMNATFSDSNDFSRYFLYFQECQKFYSSNDLPLHCFTFTRRADGHAMRTCSKFGGVRPFYNFHKKKIFLYQSFLVIVFKKVLHLMFSFLGANNWRIYKNKIKQQYCRGNCVNLVREKKENTAFLTNTWSELRMFCSWRSMLLNHCG